ncbi:hypothetical protein SLNWT_3917 [Streptomyces albus]|uniref:Uncharacterized protein n=1 Tax=Streptomyces albus (strain ATCC 21838 / DSM 41398 / FERM P-419 / JCM 4703 / NBRC 107858) TaxID=1081613 RepID=A0A0B5ENQ4_STRA4|nr:hypothetical protein SLNWT_3917 [Streptomyces albus]AOU78601.1 hypothetical protein SLNHY_3910 [Streptomyces albus]AYN34340.1 hypothetical protein DUI70_3842 [Streptomyces albus]
MGCCLRGLPPGPCPPEGTGRRAERPPGHDSCQDRSQHIT